MPEAQSGREEECGERRSVERGGVWREEKSREA
jgi:hypothetical protein